MLSDLRLLFKRDCSGDSRPVRDEEDEVAGLNLAAGTGWLFRRATRLPKQPAASAATITAVAMPVWRRPKFWAAKPIPITAVDVAA